MLRQFPYSKMSQLHIYPVTFRVFSHTGHYRVLSGVPCAIWSLLVIYFVHSSTYVSIPNSMVAFFNRASSEQTA